MSRATGLQRYMQYSFYETMQVSHMHSLALDAQATLIDINFDAEKYYICVQDNGQGISSDVLPRLAQRHGK